MLENKANHVWSWGEEEGVKTQTNQEQKVWHWWTLSSIYEKLCVFLSSRQPNGWFVASQDCWGPKIAVLVAVLNVQRLWLRLKRLPALWFITADQSVMSSHESAQLRRFIACLHHRVRMGGKKNKERRHTRWSRGFRTLSAHISLVDARSAPSACEELKCDCTLMKHDWIAIGKASLSRLQSLEFSLPEGKWIRLLVEAAYCFFLFPFSQLLTPFLNFTSSYLRMLVGRVHSHQREQRES